MCKGNCGKCKKAEFETTDVQVESLAERSGVIVDDIKIGVTDGDDSQELQPTCMRAKSERDLVGIALDAIVNDSELDKANKNIDCSFAIMKAVQAMIRAGYRK